MTRRARFLAALLLVVGIGMVLGGWRTSGYLQAVLLQFGSTLKVVSQRIGHASPMVTMTIYQHVLPGDDQVAAAVGARAILGDG